MIWLLNPNTSAATTAAMVEIARAAAPGLAIEGRTAPFGAPLITDEPALARGAEAVLAMADGAGLDRAGPDGTGPNGTGPSGTRAEGLIVAAFGDPGLDALRARLSIPVTGIGEASFRAAAAHGRFGIATTTPALEAAIAARVAAAGLARAFTGCRFTAGDPAALTATPDALAGALARAVEACLADGAEAVIIGGGPLARAAQALAPRFAIPIIEPVPAAARAMARLIHGPS